MPISSSSPEYPYVSTSFNTDSPCLSNYETTAVAYGSIYIENRPRSSRARPSDLLANLTSRTRATTAVQIPGLQRKDFNYRGYYSCKGISGYSAWGFSQLSDTTISDVGEPANPPWQNAVRDRFQQQTINLAADCAQYRETGNMFLDLAKGVRDVYKDARRLRFGKYMKPKKWADIYLGYKFGVAPLVSTTVDAVQRLNETVGFPRRGVIHATEADFLEKLVSGPYGGTIHGYSKKSSRATIVYVNAPQRQFIDAGTPLEWAWELIPFSFIVDWGIQVGDWLTRLDALKGIQSSWGCVSNRLEWTSVADRILSPGYTCIRPSVRFYRAHDRSTVLSIPLPKLRYEPSVTLERVKTGLAMMTPKHLR